MDINQIPDIRNTPVLTSGNVLSDGLTLNNDNSSIRQDFIQDAVYCSSSPNIPQSSCPEGDTVVRSATIANTESDLFKTDSSLNDVLTDINNGRVSDIRVSKPSVLDNQLPENVIINSDNRENAVKGIIDQTALSNYFFSRDNTDIIQDTIRYNVHKNTQQIISKQSENELYIIMRAVLLQYGNFSSGAQELVYEIKKLNKIVVDYSVEEVSSNVKQYIQYIQDLNTLPTPISFPQSTREYNYTYNISNIL